VGPRCRRRSGCPLSRWRSGTGCTRRRARCTLDYGSLKKRLDAAGGAQRVLAPAFIELPAARPTGLGPCVIDLEGRRSRRLRIEVTGVAAADPVTLAQVAG
jgi:hypothetical protein